MLLSSWNLPYDHLLICTNIIFQNPQKIPCFVLQFILLWPNINFSFLKSHIIMSHNLSHYDSKLISPVPKRHLVQVRNSSWYDLISTSPVPKCQLVLSHNLSCYAIIWTSPVPKNQLVLSHNLSHNYPILTSPVPKNHIVWPITQLVMTQDQLLLSQIVTFFCPIICLVMTYNQLLLTQKSHCFVPSFIWLWPYINFSCPI